MTHVQHTTGQANLPDLGQTIAYQANRAGGAERFPAPAVPTSIAVDRALLDDDDPRLRDRAWALGTLAKPPDANTLYWRQTLPGVGQSRSRVRWSEIPAIARFPRGQAVVSDGRWGTWAQASAGKRSGPSGPKLGHAALTGAFSDAAVLCRRTTPAGPTSLARLTKQHGQARTVRAHQLARAVYDMLQRGTAFPRDHFLPGSERGAGALAAELGPQGAA